MSNLTDTEQKDLTKNTTKPTRKPDKAPRPNLAGLTQFVVPTAKKPAENSPRESDADDDLTRFLPKIAEDTGAPATESPKTDKVDPLVIPVQMQVTQAAKDGAAINLSKAAKAVQKLNSSNKDAKRTSMDWPEGMQEQIKIIFPFRGMASMKDYLVSLVKADMETLPPAMKSVLALMDEQVKKDRKKRKG